METQTQATTINSMEQCWNLLGGAGWCLLGLTKNRINELSCNDLTKLAFITDTTIHKHDLLFAMPQKCL